MSRYLMKIRYIGTYYHGWQVQDNAVTVQKTVQDALEKVFQTRPGVTGCSRTDSGVHACEFCFHFDIETSIPAQNIVKAVNVFLPKDISAFYCEQKNNDFHARYFVKSKCYKYCFYDGDTRNPFYEDFCFNTGNKIDEKQLDLAAKQFVGKYDFSAFCASGSSVEDTNRNVFSAFVKRNGDLVEFYVEADGFLYNMVRIMAGTLYYVSLGKISPNDIKKIILSKKRENAGMTAPAKGLFLYMVNY